MAGKVYANGQPIGATTGATKQAMTYGGGAYAPWGGSEQAYLNSGAASFAPIGGGLVGKRASMPQAIAASGQQQPAANAPQPVGYQPPAPLQPAPMTPIPTVPTPTTTPTTGAGSTNSSGTNAGTNAGVNAGNTSGNVPQYGTMPTYGAPTFSGQELLTPESIAQQVGAIKAAGQAAPPPNLFDKRYLTPAQQKKLTDMYMTNQSAQSKTAATDFQRQATDASQQYQEGLASLGLANANLLSQFNQNNLGRQTLGLDFVKQLLGPLTTNIGGVTTQLLANPLAGLLG